MPLALLIPYLNCLYILIVTIVTDRLWQPSRHKGSSWWTLGPQPFNKLEIMGISLSLRLSGYPAWSISNIFMFFVHLQFALVYTSTTLMLKQPSWMVLLMPPFTFDSHLAVVTDQVKQFTFFTPSTASNKLLVSGMIFLIQDLQRLATKEFMLITASM